ncbi:MAG: class I SAM-dependent methyltransferase [Desulfobacteraceae bacterium]
MKNERSYVLDDDSLAAQRLRMLDSTYGPASRRLLSHLIEPGMRVADFGCGPGLLTNWVAEQMGPEGYVVGVDSSAEFIAYARSQAASLKRNGVQFTNSDVLATPLSPREFDLVFCRFLLVHLQRPLDCLREMARLLKPGGWLVAEECELSSGFTEPHCPEYQMMLQAMVQIGLAINVDYDLGPKLPGLFRALGFERLQIHVQQPTYMQGEKKRFWEYTFIEGAEKAIASGLTAREKVERLANRVSAITCDTETVVGLSRSFQVWCQKQ